MLRAGQGGLPRGGATAYDLAAGSSASTEWEADIPHPPREASKAGSGAPPYRFVGRDRILRPG